MTDSEIIKECRKRGLQNGSALGFHSGFMDMVADRLEELITENRRQQAEIERLTDLNKVLDRDVFNAEMNLENLQQHIFEIREWEAEVKFLKKKIQDEAITEFAERLKEDCPDKLLVISFDALDCIVEEMRKD